jgi:hypothetical protein
MIFPNVRITTEEPKAFHPEEQAASAADLSVDRALGTLRLIWIAASKTDAASN